MRKLSRTFHSSAASYIAMWRLLILALGAMIVAAALLGQIRGNRFPAYQDLALSLFIPAAIYAVMAIGTYIGCLLFPVRLGPEGIECSNFFGVPTFVAWSSIQSVYVRNISGVPYIFVEAEGRKMPVAVPVWLRDPRGFGQAVLEYADAENPLAQLVSGTKT